MRYYFSYDIYKYYKTYLPKLSEIIEESSSDTGILNESVNHLKEFIDEDGNKEVIEKIIQFRAPNFITKKTYPAYVNYHLELGQDSELVTPASPAEADTLFKIATLSAAKGVSFITSGAFCKILLVICVSVNNCVCTSSWRYA